MVAARALWLAAQMATNIKSTHFVLLFMFSPPTFDTSVAFRRRVVQSTRNVTTFLKKSVRFSFCGHFCLKFDLGRGIIRRDEGEGVGLPFDASAAEPRTLAERIRQGDPSAETELVHEFSHRISVM